MDHVTTANEIDQEIETVMSERGVDRDEAATIVGLRRGELLGDGDILFMRPLTDEQRRRLGLGRSIHDVVAADRARQNGTKTTSFDSRADDQS